MTGHRIELSLDSDSGISAQFVCEEPGGLCHKTCTYGCEVWNADCLANHPHEVVKYCNCIEYVDNYGMWWEQYIGEETEPRSGSIVFEWQSEEWYGWRYEVSTVKEGPHTTPDEWADWGTDDNVYENPNKPSWIERITNSFRGASPS